MTNLTLPSVQGNIQKITARIVLDPSEREFEWAGRMYVLPVRFRETLACGCQREVLLTSAHQQPGVADRVRVEWRRLVYAVARGRPFDPVQHIGPKARLCRRDQPACRADAMLRAWRKVARSINDEVRRRERARGLDMFEYQR